MNKKARILAMIENHLITVDEIEYEQGISVPTDVITKWNLNEYIQACAAAKEVLMYIENEIGGPGQIERVA